MPAPANNDELIDLVRKSGVLDDKRLDAYLAKATAANAVPPRPGEFAGLMVRDGLLTHFQAEQFLQGKWRRFTIGRYKVLERLGAGGMGSVYLCEHKLMRRRVAVKVLPTAKAEDPASLERFYREARAVAALDHPNIVRAYDIDQDDKLHFLVMEYVDGANFQEIIKRTGPMDVLRAAHYTRQAALGIQHAHETAGLVHRDIKPGNILVDRNGIVKILDMGLARFFHDQDDILTKKYDENVLGTADYLAPEQALDSHAVDIRADIYSLGATFYFILTGRPPFAEGTVAQKLIWHQTRQPKSVRLIRPDVPEGLAAVIERAMAKDPAQRYQTPADIAEALAPWTTTPIPPPPEAEMPQLSPAAMGDPSMRGAPSDPPSGTRRPWQVGGGAPSSSASVQPPSSPSGPAAPGPPAPAVNPRRSGPMQVVAPAPAAPTVMAGPAMAAPAAVRPLAAVQPAGKAPLRPALAPVPLRPAPAPARPAVAPAPAPAARPEEEEAPSWDKLISDTKDNAAHLDTPGSGAKAPPKSGASRQGVSGGVLASVLASKRRLWIIVGVTAGITVLIAVAVGLVIAFSSGPRTGGPAAPEPLRVDPNPTSKAFHTIQDAVNRAGANDHIQLMADVEEGQVTVKKANVVIESGPDQRAVWKFRGGTDARMLIVDSAPGFELKDVALDGAGKADILINLLGDCPGLKLNDLDLRNFKQNAVYLWGCDGTPAQPIALSDLRVSTSDAAQSALNFTYASSRIKESKNIVVRSCRLEGPGRKVTAASPDAIKEVKLPDEWK